MRTRVEAGALLPRLADLNGSGDAAGMIVDAVGVPAAPVMIMVELYAPKMTEVEPVGNEVTNEIGVPADPTVTTLDCETASILVLELVGTGTTVEVGMSKGIEMTIVESDVPSPRTLLKVDAVVSAPEDGTSGSVPGPGVERFVTTDEPPGTMRVYEEGSPLAGLVLVVNVDGR